MGIGDMPRRLEEKLASVLSAGDYKTICDNCGLPGDIDFQSIDDIEVELCRECYLKIKLLIEG